MQQPCPQLLRHQPTAICKPVSRSKISVRKPLNPLHSAECSRGWRKHIPTAAPTTSPAETRHTVTRTKCCKTRHLALVTTSVSHHSTAAKPCQTSTISKTGHFFKSGQRFILTSETVEPATQCGLRPQPPHQQPVPADPSHQMLQTHMIRTSGLPYAHPHCHHDMP